MNWLGMFTALLIASSILCSILFPIGMAEYLGRDNTKVLKMLTMPLAVAVVSALIVGALS